MAGEAEPAFADARARRRGRPKPLRERGRRRVPRKVGVVAVVAAATAKTGVVLGLMVGRRRGAAYQNLLGKAAVVDERPAPAVRAV